MSVNKSKAAAPVEISSPLESLDRNSSRRFDWKRRLLYPGGGLLLVALLVVGVMGKQGWLPAMDAMTGKKTGWFGNEATGNDSANSFSPNAGAAALTSTPSATPQLSKEYIYAGSRMLAVEDANANAAPPADLAVWRGTSGQWFVLGGQGSQPTTVQLGQTYDVPAPGDYDGDGKTDFAVFRPGTGGNNLATWFIQPSSGGSYYALQFGLNTDVRAQADYDGDGRTDIAVWRPAGGFWFVLRSSDQSVQTLQLGDPNDKPVPADFDGDGQADAAVYRAGAAGGTNLSNFYYLRSTQPSAIYQSKQLGQTGDKAVVGDFDGDGKADIGVYRPTTASDWFISMSGQNYTGNPIQVQWGAAGDELVPNDYDGDGKVDVAVWRPTNGTWYILQSATNTARVVSWGQMGDTPVPAFYRR